MASFVNGIAVVAEEARGTAENTARLVRASRIRSRETREKSAEDIIRALTANRTSVDQVVEFFFFFSKSHEKDSLFIIHFSNAIFLLREFVQSSKKVDAFFGGYSKIQRFDKILPTILFAFER